MKNSTLHSSAQRVQDIVHNLGFACTVIELDASTRTAQEAASALNCTLAQIIKSLIFITQDTRRPILVLASGINRVNEKTIEQHVHEKIKKADANFVKEVTGFAIGGVPPIGHIQQLQTYIDQDLLQHDIVWAAAGTPHAVFSIHPMDLRKLVHGCEISIT